jgi:hypothetical protein
MLHSALAIVLLLVPRTAAWPLDRRLRVLAVDDGKLTDTRVGAALALWHSLAVELTLVQVSTGEAPQAAWKTAAGTSARS